MRSGVKLSTIEESARDTATLSKTIGSWAALAYMERAKELSAALLKLKESVSDLAPMLSELNEDEFKKKIADLRENIQKEITRCYDHLLDKEMLKNDRPAFMATLRQFILTIDSYSANLEKIKEMYLYSIRKVRDLNLEVDALKTKIKEVTECPENQKKYNFCIDYYAAQRTEYEGLLNGIDSCIQPFTQFRLAINIIQRDSEIKSIQECNGLINDFMGKTVIANYIKGAKLQLSYKKPTEQPQAPEPLTPSTVIAPIPLEPVPAATNTANRVYTDRSGSPVKWQQPHLTTNVENAAPQHNNILRK